MIYSITKIKRKGKSFKKLKWMISEFNEKYWTIRDIEIGKQCITYFVDERKNIIKFDHFIKSNIEIDGKKLFFDRRRLFFDSSIWFRYAESTHQEKYLIAESTILSNFYDLTSALEFREFQIRLFENSWLDPKYQIDNHGSHVTPFLFHSETEMDENTSDKINFIKKSLNDLKIEEWSWNILIADDKARPNNGSFCKLEAIKTVLCKLPYKNLDVTCEFDANNIKLKFITGEVLNFNFHVQNSFEDAKKSIINDYTNDVILLDYLFIERADDEKCNYGDSIIDELSNRKGNKKRWILPISAYNFAFLESINSKGLPFYDENYVLSTGGDPICTPHLFRSKFFEMLHLQLSELLTSTSGTHDSFKSHFIKLCECDSNEKIVAYLKVNIFNLLELGNKLNFLIDAKTTGSAFAESAIEKLYFKIDRIEAYEQLELFLVTLKTGLKLTLFQLEKCYNTIQTIKGDSDLEELLCVMKKTIENFMK